MSGSHLRVIVAPSRVVDLSDGVDAPNLKHCYELASAEVQGLQETSMMTMIDTDLLKLMVHFMDLLEPSSILSY